jgi:hypothetical protein
VERLWVVVQTALMNEQASPNFAGASARFRHIPALASTPFTQQREASSNHW